MADATLSASRYEKGEEPMDRGTHQQNGTCLFVDAKPNLDEA